MKLLLSSLIELTPHIHPVYQEALAQAEEVLPKFEINTPLRWLHFLAQTAHETRGYSLLIENLSYSAERLMQVWPNRFPTLHTALPYARNPRALANKVYGGRLGNMNAEDGWAFRGRGLLQITGRHNYQRVTDILGQDFINRPDDTLLPSTVLSVAAAVWLDRRANEPADLDDTFEVTRRVNGGTIGLADRTAWLLKIKDGVINA